MRLPQMKQQSQEKRSSITRALQIFLSLSTSYMALSQKRLPKKKVFGKRGKTCGPRLGFLFDPARHILIA